MAFPLPNVTTFPGIMNHANVLTDNLFGISVLTIIFAVAFINGSRDDASRAFGMASFVTMLFGFFFGVLNLISGEIVIVTIVLVAISAFAIKRND